jgi:hypothetical protein
MDILANFIEEVSGLAEVIVHGEKGEPMAEIKVPIQVNLPDDWVEQIVDRLRNDPDAEWVEVTRCKDCKHYRRDNSGLYYCEREDYGYGWGLNDFCSDAERRTDEGFD